MIQHPNYHEIKNHAKEWMTNVFFSSLPEDLNLCVFIDDPQHINLNLFHKFKSVLFCLHNIDGLSDFQQKYKEHQKEEHKEEHKQDIDFLPLDIINVPLPYTDIQHQYKYDVFFCFSQNQTVFRLKENLDTMHKNINFLLSLCGIFAMVSSDFAKIWAQIQSGKQKFQELPFFENGYNIIPIPLWKKLAKEKGLELLCVKYFGEYQIENKTHFDTYTKKYFHGLVKEDYEKNVANDKNKTDYSGFEKMENKGDLLALYVFKKFNHFLKKKSEK